MSIYTSILSAAKQKQLLAILLDPDKINIATALPLINKINQSPIDYIFVGGSTVTAGDTQVLVTFLKQHTQKPIILFPGDASQLCADADALLFLTLLSGRNPKYLIEQHIEAVPFLEKHQLESISTGYILIDGDKNTATMQVTNTQPIAVTDVEFIRKTAKAGELLGNKFIYLEAGSGAKTPVPQNVIKAVQETVTIPIIVGGGMRNATQIQDAFNAKATIVVIGTAFEEDIHFFDQLTQLKTI